MDYLLSTHKLKVEPFQIFQALEQERNCFFLDSSLNSNSSLGRYSFIGINPFYILETRGQEPFIKLRELMNRYEIAASKRKESLPFGFLGGAVGYLSYDLGFLLEEKLKKKTSDDLGIPESFFAFYNTIIITDNIKKILYICALGFPEKKYHLAKALGESNSKKIKCLLGKKDFNKPRQRKHKAQNKFIEPKPNFSKNNYLLSVNKAKQYIKQGDIYQVNLSQRFEAKTSMPSFEIYRNLRRISPSYFGAFLDTGDFQIISSSPERFLRLEGNKVITRPMKGTRPRGRDKKHDAHLRKELINSQKDKAELTMIVDLERNDLGRVCDYDSVKVKSLRELERYNTVYQTTSTIEGRLYKNKDRFDLLRACFPGGSITGCPKIRAMEIIEELEPNRRGIYTGSLGYLSFSGSMDFNILIRTILKKKDRLYFGVGGGIVADSKPEEEYAETLVKARAMMEAIKKRRP